MITDKDIEKLTAVLASKKDVENLSERVDHLTEITQGMLSSLDKLVKELQEVRLENASMGLQMDRHEKWIKEIADKVGIKLIS